MLVLGGIAFIVASAVPRSFNARDWTTSAPPSNLRFRMPHDLVRRMKAERWTRTRVVAELGHPDAVGAGEMTYQLGPKPPAYFNSDFFLDIDFDEGVRYLLRGSIRRDGGTQKRCQPWQSPYPTGVAWRVCSRRGDKEEKGTFRTPFT